MNPLSVLHLRKKHNGKNKFLTCFNRERHFAPPLTKIFRIFKKNRLLHPLNRSTDELKFSHSHCIISDVGN